MGLLCRIFILKLPSSCSAPCMLVFITRSLICFFFLFSTSHILTFPQSIPRCRYAQSFLPSVNYGTLTVLAHNSRFVSTEVRFLIFYSVVPSPSLQELENSNKEMPNDGWEGVKRKKKGRGDAPGEEKSRIEQLCARIQQLLYHALPSYHWL
jgi:hypothetical protein